MLANAKMRNKKCRIHLRQNQNKSVQTAYWQVFAAGWKNVFCHEKNRPGKNQFFARAVFFHTNARTVHTNWQNHNQK